jgi:hypothetical protein
VSTATADRPVATEDTEAPDATTGTADVDQAAGQDHPEVLPDDDPRPPHGPGAARHVAQQLAEDGHHSHLNAEGQSHCMSGMCALPILDFGPGAH